MCAKVCNKKLHLILICLQGPVLSAHKKLLAEKLVEEEIERKDKGEAKKEKHLVLLSELLCTLFFYFYFFKKDFVILFG